MMDLGMGDRQETTAVELGHEAGKKVEAVVAVLSDVVAAEDVPVRPDAD